MDGRMSATSATSAAVALSSFGLGAFVATYYFHRRSATPAPEETVEDGPPLSCSLCERNLPPSAFFTKQASKRPDKRKCTECIYSFVRPTHPVAKKCADKLQLEVAPPAPDEPSAAAAEEEPALPDFSSMYDVPEDPLRLARKAETVLRGRTERVLLVLEGCSDDLNHVAVLRTCEAMGVMRVFLVEAASRQLGLQPRQWPMANTGESGAAADASSAAAAGATSRAAGSRARRRLAARARERGFTCDPLLGVRAARLYCSYLDVRTFPDVQACVEALRGDGRTIWATDLAQEASPLDGDVSSLAAELPARVAVVMGSEGAGVSPTFLALADRRVYLPMRGFTESYNLSVATALVLQRVLDACAIGETAEERGELPEPQAAVLRAQWYRALARSDNMRAEFARLAAAGGVAPFDDLRRPEKFRAEKRVDWRKTRTES